MGSDIELNFSKAVKISIGGMAGKRAGWTRGTALTDITTVCNSVVAPTNIDPTTIRECYIDSGNDLVIWTYHFTKFAAYTPLTTTGGGGGRSRDRTVEPYIPLQITGPAPEIPTPIEATPPAPTPGFFAAITGAIIGALGTGGSIIVISFIVSVVGLMVILRIRKKVEDLKIKKAVEGLKTKKNVENLKIKRKRKKGKKINEKGDQDET